MIFYKTGEEIERIKKSSLLVGKTLAEVAKIIRPGVTTLDLDKVAEEFIRDNKAIPGFLGYGGFPNTLCTSVNSAVVHGIPNDKPLMDGDIVSVEIDPELFESGDREMVQDLIVVAANQALKEGRETLAREMEKLTGGLGIDIGGLF